MVKVQKPSPKTFKNAPKKPNKSNGIKKENPAKDSKAIPASNVTAKKAKTNLIEKAVQEKQLEQVKPIKNVGQVKTEAPKSKKWEKKNGPKKNQAALVKNVETNAPAKKSPAALVAEIVQTKKAAGEAKPQVQVGKAQKKNANAANKQLGQKQDNEATEEGKPQEQLGKKQKKNANAANKQLGKKQDNEPTEEGKPQQQLGKKQKKEVTTEGKPQQQLGKKQKREATPAGKPQQQLAKKQKKAATTKGKPLQQLSKKPKKKPVPASQKKVVIPLQYEQLPFDEEQYNKVVNSENIKKIAEALKTLAEKQVSEKKTSIFTDYRFYLNVCSYKIGNCPKRIVKLNLKHSLVDTKEDEVVIIVPDLQRGAKVDYEPTIQHYEDLFREAGVTGLKIMPFNQLRRECTNFETKRKFASTYDYFLCDGRIVSHVVGFCGSHFQKPRTTFHAVRLNNKKAYKRDIDHALNRTAYKQLQKGDLVSIPVGNHRFSVEHLADNIQLVMKQLKTLFPGGLGNIRNMHLKIDIKGTSSLPLYVNLAGAPAETPTIIGLREQRMLKLKKEANEVLAQFNLSNTGEFVKLDKGQVERKRQMQEARKALLSNPLVVDETEETPAKKSKKNKNEVEPESIGEVKAEEDEEEVAEDSDNDDDEEEGSDDGENEDDDDDEVVSDDDDDEGGSDDDDNDE